MQNPNRPTIISMATLPFRNAGVPPGLLTCFGHHVRRAKQSHLLKQHRPRFPFSIFPFPILPAAAPPQTTPPPPPPTHSTTAPAQSSESNPDTRIASASTHAILRPHRPAQFQLHP